MAKKKKKKDDQPQDQLGKYPKDFDIPALEERRYLWILRVFAIAFGVSMALNIALAYVAIVMFPLKKVEPFLVTFREKDQQLVQVMPMQKTMAGFDIMTEGLIRQYLSLTEEIMPNEEVMKKRWGGVSWVAQYSAQDVYLKFNRRAMPAMKEFVERNWSRVVTINSLEQVAPGFWNVDYETTVLDDLGEAVMPENQRWIASLTVTFQQRRVSYEESLLNPFGFTVTAFGVRQKT
ncbi:MAG: VirB8/TrbF family protein [Alphaproteobacteria bacterium]